MHGRFVKLSTVCKSGGLESKVYHDAELVENCRQNLSQMVVGPILESPPCVFTLEPKI